MDLLAARAHNKASSIAPFILNNSQSFGISHIGEFRIILNFNFGFSLEVRKSDDFKVILVFLFIFEKHSVFIFLAVRYIDPPLGLSILDHVVVEIPGRIMDQDGVLLAQHDEMSVILSCENLATFLGVF